MNEVTFVVYPFVNWIKGDTGIYSKYHIGSSIIVIIKGDNNPLKFTSIRGAENGLGIPRTTLMRHINYINYPLFSHTLNKFVYIININQPLISGEIDYKKRAEHPMTGIDIRKLELGKLYAFLKDKHTIYGTYSSARSASLILDGKTECRYISRYINKERLVLAGPDKIPLYFVLNLRDKVTKKKLDGSKDNSKNRKIRLPLHIELYSFLEEIPLVSNKEEAQICLMKTPLGKNKKIYYKKGNPSIVLVDTLKNTSVLYNSSSDLALALGLKRKSYSLFSRYLNPTRLYKGRYEFHLYETYKGEITGRGPTIS